MGEETAEQKVTREAAEAVAAKGKGKGEEEGEKVILEPEQYNALLDRLQELEELTLKGGKGKIKTVDELADDLEDDDQRGQRGRQRQIDPNKINELSNTELARLILAEVQQNVAMPLLTKLEEFRVKDEIKELRKDLGEDDDFDDLKEEIYQVASKNPNLTIKQAYKLAKKESSPKRKDSSDDDEPEGKSKKKDALLHLPPRIHSERPTHARGATDKGAPETRAEAANRAYEDLEKSGLLK